MRRLQLPCLAICAVAAAAFGGCGEEGAANGATVSVYVAGSLCKEAQRQVAAVGAMAGNLEVRVACLPAPGSEGSLAAAGANARRATEDSASVAYLEAPGPTAEFSHSIVEAAGIAWLRTSSGSATMRRILAALAGDDSSPRRAVLDEVG